MAQIMSIYQGWDGRCINEEGFLWHSDSFNNQRRSGLGQPSRADALYGQEKVSSRIHRCA